MSSVITFPNYHVSKCEAANTATPVAVQADQLLLLLQLKSGLGPHLVAGGHNGDRGWLRIGEM